jgi:hypothetical protein
MDEFLKMDIFFFVATLATVVIAALIAWALVRIVRILGKVEDITDSAAAEAELLRGDIGTLRENVKSEGLKFKHLSRFVRASMERWMGGTKGK